MLEVAERAEDVEMGNEEFPLEPAAASTSSVAPAQTVEELDEDRFADPEEMDTSESDECWKKESITPQPSSSYAPVGAYNDLDDDGLDASKLETTNSSSVTSAPTDPVALTPGTSMATEAFLVHEEGEGNGTGSVEPAFVNSLGPSQTTTIPVTSAPSDWLFPTHVPTSALSTRPVFRPIPTKTSQTSEGVNDEVTTQALPENKEYGDDSKDCHRPASPSPIASSSKLPDTRTAESVPAEPLGDLSDSSDLTDPISSRTVSPTLSPVRERPSSEVRRSFSVDIPIRTNASTPPTSRHGKHAERPEQPKIDAIIKSPTEGSDIEADDEDDVPERASYALSASKTKGKKTAAGKSIPSKTYGSKRRAKKPLVTVDIPAASSSQSTATPSRQRDASPDRVELPTATSSSLAMPPSSLPPFPPSSSKDLPPSSLPQRQEETLIMLPSSRPNSAAARSPNHFTLEIAAPLSGLSFPRPSSSPAPLGLDPSQAQSDSAQNRLTLEIAAPSSGLSSPRPTSSPAHSQPGPSQSQSQCHTQMHSLLQQSGLSSTPLTQTDQLTTSPAPKRRIPRALLERQASKSQLKGPVPGGVVMPESSTSTTASRARNRREGREFEPSIAPPVKKRRRTQKGVKKSIWDFSDEDEVVDKKAGKRKAEENVDAENGKGRTVTGSSPKKTKNPASGTSGAQTSSASIWNEAGSEEDGGLVTPKKKGSKGKSKEQESPTKNGSAKGKGTVPIRASSDQEEAKGKIGSEEKGGECLALNLNGSPELIRVTGDEVDAEQLPPTQIDHAASHSITTNASFGFVLSSVAPRETPEQRRVGWNLLKLDKLVWTLVETDQGAKFWWPADIIVDLMRPPLPLRLLRDAAESILKFQPSGEITLDEPQPTNLLSFRTNGTVRFDRAIFVESSNVEGESVPSNQDFESVLLTACELERQRGLEEDDSDSKEKKSKRKNGAKKGLKDAKGKTKKQKGKKGKGRAKGKHTSETEQSESEQEQQVEQPSSDDELLQAEDESLGMTFPVIALGRYKKQWWPCAIIGYNPPVSQNNANGHRAKGKFSVKFTDYTECELARSDLLTSNQEAFLTVKTGLTTLDVGPKYQQSLRDIVDRNHNYLKSIIDEEMVEAAYSNKEFYAGGKRRSELAKHVRSGEFTPELIEIILEQITKWASGNGGKRPTGSKRYEALSQVEKIQYQADVILPIMLQIVTMDESDHMYEAKEVLTRADPTMEPTAAGVEKKAFELARAQLELGSVSKTIEAIRNRHRG